MIIEGTVLRSGDRVRISVQLIEAATDSHIWAETYERELRDVLTLQSEVARAIAREIQVKLTPEEQAILGKAQAIDPEAYEAYLKGRYHWNRRSGEGLERANRYFQQAVTKDPKYAAAYAGLADCANIAGWYGFASPKEGSGKGKELALGALAMDYSLAEAHCSLAWGLLHYDFNFPEAEREFHRSLELDPLNATTVLWYAVYLSAIGHCDQSTRESVRALHLDPLSPRVITVAGMQFFIARRYDEAIAMCRKALELDPSFSFARWTIAGSLVEQGNPEAAIAEMDEVVRSTSRVPIHLYMLAHSHARSGSRERALRLVQELHELSQNHYISPIWFAVIYTSLNEKDEAFRWLDCAYRERACWMVYMKSWPWSDNLRSDPRFDDLVRRMNYPA
jgi:tetratricopeptide (TPR) repeat protein